MDQDELEPRRDFAISLRGATLGRRIGFMRAQSMAAQAILDNVADSAEAMRLFRLIMDMHDAVDK
jgi:hypothetical protein